MDKAPTILLEDNPAPDGLEPRFLRAQDGGRLRVAFLPCEDAIATVLVHPGWSEFLEKYYETADDLRRRRFNVVLCDPRGQGYSQRLTPTDARGLITDFRQFSDDFDVIVSAMGARFPGPYFVLAHSMGGLITLEWLLRADRAVPMSGAVLAAPLTRLFPSQVKRILVRNIARWGVLLGAARRHLPAAPEHSMNFETNTLTQDPRRHDRFKRLQITAPEAQAGAPLFSWLHAAQTAMMRIGRPGALAPIDIPVLIVSADNDVTVDPTHHRVLASEYRHIDIVRIDDARHELLMERDDFRDQFWAAFDSYMSARLASLGADSVYDPPDTSSTAPSSTRSSRMSAN